MIHIVASGSPPDCVFRGRAIADLPITYPIPPGEPYTSTDRQSLPKWIIPAAIVVLLMLFARKGAR